MNDLFRAIFGIRNDQPRERMDDRPQQGYTGNFGGNLGDDDDDDDEDNGINMRSGFGTGFFGFPLFNDPVDIHKHFDRLVNEMNKAFGVFGFHNGPSITWEGDSENGSPFFREPPQQRTESLRDAYLKKPDCSCDKISRNDINYGSNIKPRDFEAGPSHNTVQYSYPKVYSKSVFIQRVRRPDGSVETIRKVRDHEGNEETTISQSNVNDPLPPPPEGPITPKEDTSGLSIFKKFFSF